MVNRENDDQRTNSRDVSFRSCLCSLLIFASICLIFLIGIKLLKTNTAHDGQLQKDSQTYLTERPVPKRPEFEKTNSLETTTFPYFIKRRTKSFRHYATRTSRTTMYEESTTPNYEPDENEDVGQVNDYVDPDIDVTENDQDDNKDQIIHITLNSSYTNEWDFENITVTETVTDFNSTEIFNFTTQDVYNDTQNTTLKNTQEITLLSSEAEAGLTTEEQTSETKLETSEAMESASTLINEITITTTPTILLTTRNVLTTANPTEITKTSVKPQLPNLFSKQDPLCLSPACKLIASRLLTFMNHSIDPCENFYEFACGGLQVHDEESKIFLSIAQQLYWVNDSAATSLQKYKSFYNSCITHESEFIYEKRIEAILKLVEEVGTIYDHDPNLETFDMTNIFAKLILRQALPIMDVDVDIDKQTENFILKLTLPKKTSIFSEDGRWSAKSATQRRCLEGLHDKLLGRNVNLTEIHETYLECQKNHAVYLNSIQNTVRALGFFSHLNDTYNQTQQIQELRTTIEWDILDHLNVLPPPSIIRKTLLFKDYTLLKISDLQVQYPYLQWNQLFETLTGHNIANKTLIQVYFPKYFSKLFSELNKLPKWKINNGIIAIFAHDLFENLVVSVARKDREEYCTRLSSKFFHDIASNLYTKTWTKEDIDYSQKLLIRTFDHLMYNFTSALNNVSWLDDSSKTSMLLKVQKLNLVTSTNEDLYNNITYLNMKYGHIDITAKDFPSNALKMVKRNREMLYGLEGKPYTINYLWSYFLNPYDSQPSSFYSKHLIVAPIGMIRQPIRGIPGYIVMAQLGLSLAREIARHFDPVGINYHMSLSPAAKPSYEAFKMNVNNAMAYTSTRFLRNQMFSFKVDGQLSLNERIVDNTALRMAYDGFSTMGNDMLLPWISSTYSREKLFFLKSAQEYCKETDITDYMLQLFESDVLPAPLRVENIMTNSDAFVEAFECPEGSAMNNNYMKAQFPFIPKSDEQYNYNYDTNTDDT